MSDSTSEGILKALFAAVKAAAPSCAEVQRNAALPQRVAGGGALIVRDGDPGEPEVTLSPARWHYQHRAQIDVLVSGVDDAARDAAFDELRRSVAGSISSDRTLGGLCDWVEAEPPAPQEVSETGASPMKVGVIPIVLHYSTDDPLL